MLNDAQKKAYWKSLQNTVAYYMSKNMAGELSTSFSFLAVSEEAERIFNRVYRADHVETLPK